MTTQDRIKNLINRISKEAKDDTETLNVLPYSADLSGDFPSDEEWSEFCEFLVECGRENDLALRFSTEYKNAQFSRDVGAEIVMLQSDMVHNEIWAAVGAYTTGLFNFSELDLIPASAYHRHVRSGLKDEFAAMRFLHWCGCNVNAFDEDGMTALHYVSKLLVDPGSNPRAVKWLIEHGADVNARNNLGETPMDFLAGSEKWTSEIQQAFGLLYHAGSDPLKKMENGKCAIDYMEDHQLAKHSMQREEMIDFFRDQDDDDDS